MGPGTVGLEQGGKLADAQLWAWMDGAPSHFTRASLANTMPPSPCVPAAANNTVWNVGPASKRQVALPGCDFGPHLVFVGSYAPPTPGAEGDSNSGDRRRRSLLASPQLTGWCRQRRWWVEDVPTTQQLLPRDLYAAMVATRRNRIRG